MKWNRIILFPFYLWSSVCVAQVEIVWSHELEDKYNIYELRETFNGVQFVGLDVIDQDIVFWNVDHSGSDSEVHLVPFSDSVKYSSIEQIIYLDEYIIVSGEIDYYAVGRSGITFLSNDYERLWECLVPDSLGSTSRYSMAFANDTIFMLAATSGSFVDHNYFIKGWDILGNDLPILQLPRIAGGVGLTLVEHDGLHYISDKSDALYEYVVNRSGDILHESVSDWPVEVLTTFYGGGPAITPPIQSDVSFVDGTPKISDDGSYTFVYQQDLIPGTEPEIKLLSGPHDSYGFLMGLYQKEDTYLATELLVTSDWEGIYSLTTFDSDLLIQETRSFVLSDIPDLPLQGAHGVSPDWNYHYHYYPYLDGDVEYAVFVTVDADNQYVIDTLYDGFSTSPVNSRMLVTNDAIYLYIYKQGSLGETIQQILRIGAPGLGATYLPQMESIQLFPNPFHSKLTITGLVPGNYQCRLLDLSGREVYNNKVMTDADRLQLQMGDIPNGYYLLELSGKEKVYRQSVVRF
jgi:hypothetical protein